MGGAIISRAQYILRRWRQMVALGELLALISIVFWLLYRNTTQKIKYWYDTTLCGFWLSFSVKGQQEKQCKTAFLAIIGGERHGKMPVDE